MTAKHKLKTNPTINISTKFFCEYCDYHTGRKIDFNIHCTTAKHKSRSKNPQNPQNPQHQQHQQHQQNQQHTKNIIDSEFIMKMCKENQEFKTLLIEQQNQVMELQKENNILLNKMVEITQTIPSIVNNNNTTTNNNQFNLNLFLNETCKNAINFTDFIDNIHITDDDLENNAKMGFVEGVTKIIMDNLKQLELIERPIHCTDVKRETIYVKDEDQWEKDNSKEVIQKGIQEITRKNMCQLSEWRENNPDYDNMETELGEKSIVLQQNLMAGGKRSEFYPKIIKKLAKETILGKKTN
jgi:hypothetical protein